MNERIRELNIAGRALLERSQQGVRLDWTITNTAVHHHAACEMIHWQECKEGKAFQAILDKH